MSYESGKAYRAALRGSPPKSSTPDAGPGKLAPQPQAKHLFPIGHHATAATGPHVETVGWVNGVYRDPTHPNSLGKKHGASGSTKANKQFGPGEFDKEPMRRGKSGGMNT